MLSQDDIQEQQNLLAAHRRTLAALLQQLALLGGVAYATPGVLNSIEEARENIARIKTALREGGVQVEDKPNDEAPPQADVSQAVGVGARIQSTVSVSHNEGTVIGVQINQRRPDPALHQLRAPVSDFVGRTAECAQLVQALRQAAGAGRVASISGVRGLGGIGKTELAYVVAQQLSDAFPDAQLLVELRGASTAPLTPVQALQTIIYAFEREAKLPDDVAALRAIYLTYLSGKRVLVLADDASDMAQVHPLMPPSGCALLVTSRHRFSLPGAVMRDLGTLSPAEAEHLLLEVCPRIGEHAGKLAKLCGYLPLALRVSASLLANSVRSVARYLEQLSTERMKYLVDPDDASAGVEASLLLSYDTLKPAARHALCQLSVFPTSFNQAAALAVVQVSGDTEALLDALQRRCLVEWEKQSERYSLHDLVQVFGATRLDDTDATRLRYARHYQRVASHAEDDLYLKGQTLAGLALFDQE